MQSPTERSAWLTDDLLVTLLGQVRHKPIVASIPDDEDDNDLDYMTDKTFLNSYARDYHGFEWED